MFKNISSKFKEIHSKITDKMIEIYVKTTMPTYELLELATRAEFLVIILLICFIIIF